MAGQMWKSSGEFKMHVKQLLDELAVGQIVPEPHHTFLLHLVNRHPRAAEKIGGGIRYFKVLTNTNYGGRNRCFYIFREDGTHTEFSYVKCVRSPTPWEEFVDAMRAAVVDQVVRAREAAFGSKEEILCPIRKTQMSRSVSHCDHTAPYTFAVLVKEFMEDEWLDEKFPPETEGGDLVHGRRLADKELEARWQAFHQSKAVLRVISKEAHLELKEKQHGDVQ